MTIKNHKKEATVKTNRTNMLLGQFNKTVDGWIHFLNDYTLEMLLQKPQPTSWSLGQVYVHLIKDTAYFIDQMKIALSNNANSEKEMYQDAKNMFMNNELPPVLLKGPASNSDITQPQSKQALLKKLLCIKNKVNELILTPDMEKATGKTEHPGLGFFSAPEWLQFAEMHMRHHLMQKKRIDDQFFLT
jgi:hypothetical protein